MKKKYGKNWINVIARKGYLSLEKKYGTEWRRIIAQKGHNTSKERYGKNFQKLIWEKAILSLKNKYGKDWAKVNSLKSIKANEHKYGKNWAKILMKNARKAHLKRYGKGWAKVLSKKGAKKLEEKYGKDYRKELYKLANFLGKRPLSSQEKIICENLKKNNIPFETHCVKNNREYDIVVPDSKNPKVVIESSELNPTTNNERLKILQLTEQKENFPNCLHLAILKRKGKNCNFKPSTYKFLTEKEIKIFWNEDLDLATKKIKDYLENKKIVDHIYDNFNNTRNKLFSLKGALSNKNKINHDELALHMLLKSIKAKPEGPHIIETKYDNFSIVDNYEEKDNVKLVYEITSTVNQNVLCFLAGKIIYLRESDKKLKFIVILSKRDSLTENKGDQSIIKYADAVILKNQFNIKCLTNIRNSLIQT